MLLVERGNLLRLRIFIDAKRILFEIGNQFVLTVHNHRVQYDLFYFLAENELPRIITLLSLRLRTGLSLSSISPLRSIPRVRILRPDGR